MLYFRTGKPGHGKTLNTIREIDTKAKLEGRVIYYHNVTGLKPELLQASWFPFDNPHDWFNLPPNSIIVIDEAQGFFPVRDPRQSVPEHVSRFELIRKAGHEVHLITQDPRYIDVHLRRLANGHVHYMRVFKSTQVIRFESDAVIEAVEKKTSFKDCDKKVIKLDKKYFSVYDSISSDASHHFKFKPPLKLVLAVLLIGLVFAFVFYTYNEYSQRSSANQQPAPKSDTSNPVDIAKNMISGNSNKTVQQVKPSPFDELRDYIAERTPRFNDVPFSAPIYDELTQAVAYPRLICLSSDDPKLVSKRPAKTVSNGVACQCYTQQGSKVAVAVDFCLKIVADGFFDPAQPDRTTRASSNQQPSVSSQSLVEPARQTATTQSSFNSLIKVR